MLVEEAGRAIAALATFLQANGGEGTGEVLSRLAEQDLKVTQNVPPQSKPVVRFLPQSLQAASVAFPEIASALAAIGSRLSWSQSSSYSDDILGQGFSDNYAWAELIGPMGIFPGDDFTLGFLLLGPNRHYIDHYHPAPELYLPLTPASRWKKGDSDFIERRQGEVIWHPSMVVHATKTFAAPLIAAFVWTRDIETPARLKLPAQ